MQDLYEKFVHQINEDEKNPLSIQEEVHENESFGGYYNAATNDIVINTVVSQTANQKFRVLIHEYAHCLHHNKESELRELSRGHRETQAESASYIVLTTTD
jgi:Zn-dependent peptidase ImmA (M78 family)